MGLVRGKSGRVCSDKVCGGESEKGGRLNITVSPGGPVGGGDACIEGHPGDKRTEGNLLKDTPVVHSDTGVNIVHEPDTHSCSPLSSYAPPPLLLRPPCPPLPPPPCARAPCPRFERDDVDAVVNYLNEQPEVLSIGAWGSNTGAAALIMYAARKPSVFSFMILDAVYESFEACLTEAMRQTQGSISVPQMMIKMGLKVVMGSVRKKLGAPIR